MKLVTKVKLQPTLEQAALLQATLERGNAACNALSQAAFATRTFRRFDLQAEYYHDLREEFRLSAQMTIRCIAKVADAYRAAKRRKRVFKFWRHGALAYDARLLSWYPDSRRVSIWSLEGRLLIAYTAADWQLALLKDQQGESDLVFSRGEFYLVAACEVSEAELQERTDFLGADFGIINLLTDSDGEAHSGRHLNGLRHRYFRIRQKLQTKGTKSAKRLLKKRSGKERRFASQVNHLLSKKLVEKAERTQRGDALEDLKGITARIRASRSQRRQLHSWRFYDLRLKIEYKAKRKGLPVVPVPPAYTSQRCSVCGYTAKRNRVNQHTFLCASCGHAAHADVNAARNIAALAVSSVPGGSSTGSISRAGTSVVNPPHAAAPLPGG